jgi:dihydroxyacetone kinase-like protein
MDGMVLAHPDVWVKFRGERNSAALMKKSRNPDAFGIIISGGAANGPLFPGYVWEGLADAAVVGGPYGAPNAYTIYETGKHLGQEHGVLLLYNNFAGDYLNNDMAQELLELDGIAVESVIAPDDIASAVVDPRDARSGRPIQKSLRNRAYRCMRPSNGPWSCSWRSCRRKGGKSCSC